MNQELEQAYERETGGKATYREDSLTYHFLGYIRWLESQVKELKITLKNEIQKSQRRIKQSS